MLHKGHDSAAAALHLLLAPTLGPLGFTTVRGTYDLRAPREDGWVGYCFNFGLYPGQTSVNPQAIVNMGSVERLVARLNGQSGRSLRTSHTATVIQNLGHWASLRADYADILESLAAALLAARASVHGVYRTPEDVLAACERVLRGERVIQGRGIHLAMRHLCCLYLRRDWQLLGEVRDRWLKAWQGVSEQERGNLERVGQVARYLEEHWDEELECGGK